MSRFKYETNPTEYSLISGTNKRIKHLGWYENSIIARNCAERRFVLSEHTNSKSRPKKSRKKKRSILGFWHCLVCDEVFEIAEQYGSRRSILEVHYYNGLLPTHLKEKNDCPKCTGTLSDFKVIGLH